MRRYAVANWKMNVPAEGLGAYLDAVGTPEGMIIAPPFPYVKELAARVAVAGQNCADQKSGPFTGEVAPQMLRECGASFVIVGHSERRRLFGETDELVARKLAVAIDAGLTPIFCIGEDQLIRERGGAVRFVSNQIRAAAAALGDVVAGSQPATAGLEPATTPGVREIIVAYEPVWAIGTGRNASGALVADMVGEIRAALDRFWPKPLADSAPILYGGSVTPENIDDLGQNGRIAGYLVGGASLDSARFLAICNGLERLHPA